MRIDDLDVKDPKLILEKEMNLRVETIIEVAEEETFT